MKPDQATEIFESHRAMLQGLAYRMLGSVIDAEDVVQDTFLRWSRADQSQIDSPKAWLVTVCSRLAVDALRSAHKRRAEYIGPWLPEPWNDRADTPDAAIERDESVSMALLVILETLSPAERAAFLLHDVFDVGFNEIAMVLDKTEPACRKLASRARQRIKSNRTIPSISTQEHKRLNEAFVKAARQGDENGLCQLLHRDVVLQTDGGGKATATRKPIHGREAVARFFARLYSNPRTGHPKLSASTAWLNGGFGLLVYENNQPVTALVFEIDGQEIRSIFAIRNPDKLKQFTPA